MAKSIDSEDNQTVSRKTEQTPSARSNGVVVLTEDDNDVAQL